MIELSEHPDGRITRAFGGDTLNTAVYLARLGVPVDYVTAVGDDGWSEGMVRAWSAEGVGVGRVVRVAGRMPGLYIIQTDVKGERTFSYWRSAAPARELFDMAETPTIAEALKSYSHLYFSGITLSLYDAHGRKHFFNALDAVDDAGGTIVFDSNYRPRGWAGADAAAMVFDQAMIRAKLIFASLEDLEPLFGDGLTDYLQRRVADGAEVVLKLREPGCRVMTRAGVVELMAPKVASVVDTTAAGDSFAAAYLAARIAGKEPVAAAHVAHRLAGAVVQHRGAIIPREAMPPNLLA